MTNKPGFSGGRSRCNRRPGCCDFLTDWIDNMIIPWQQLTAETLENLIETFVLREGTDYGEQERSLEQKVAEVRQQLKTGEAVLVWSELHETINIMPRTLFRG